MSNYTRLHFPPAAVLRVVGSKSSLACFSPGTVVQMREAESQQVSIYSSTQMRCRLLSSCVGILVATSFPAAGTTCSLWSQVGESSVLDALTPSVTVLPRDKECREQTSQNQKQSL